MGSTLQGWWNSKAMEKAPRDFEADRRICKLPSGEEPGQQGAVPADSQISGGIGSPPGFKVSQPREIRNRPPRVRPSQRGSLTVDWKTGAQCSETIRGSVTEWVNWNDSLGALVTHSSPSRG